MLEFNLDSGSEFTPQAYDISNIQGFTQSISVGADGCATATCTSASCGVSYSRHCVLISAIDFTFSPVLLCVCTRRFDRLRRRCTRQGLRRRTNRLHG